MDKIESHHNYINKKSKVTDMLSGERVDNNDKYKLRR